MTKSTTENINATVLKINEFFADSNLPFEIIEAHEIYLFADDSFPDVHKFFFDCRIDGKALEIKALVRDNTKDISIDKYGDYVVTKKDDCLDIHITEYRTLESVTQKDVFNINAFCSVLSMGFKKSFLILSGGYDYGKFLLNVRLYGNTMRKYFY